MEHKNRDGSKSHVQVKASLKSHTIKSQASPSHKYTQPSQVKSVVHFKQVKSSPDKGQVKSKSDYNTKQKKNSLYWPQPC